MGVPVCVFNNTTYIMYVDISIHEASHTCMY